MRRTSFTFRPGDHALDAWPPPPNRKPLPHPLFLWLRRLRLLRFFQVFYWVAGISLLTLLILSGCGGGSTAAPAAPPTPPNPPPTPPSQTPEIVDWRFQGMDLPAGTESQATDLVSFGTNTFQNFIGAPLEVGLQFDFDCGPTSPSDCAWDFFGFNSPSGIAGPTTVYMSDSLDNLDTDLSNLNTGTTVITSLDLEPANQIFAVGSLQNLQPGGYVFSSETIAPSQLQATAEQLGEQGRVITAMSYDASGNVLIVSYAWLSDTKTIYDAQAVSIPSNSTSVATADSNAIAAALINLANQGYVLTALCGNASNGLLIMGTRVKGNTSPRPFEVFLQTGHQGQVSNTVQSLWGTVHSTTPSFFVQFAEQ